MKLYDKKCEGPRTAGIRQGLLSGAAYGSSLLLLFLVYATSFYIGARFVATGKTTFPKVFQVGSRISILMCYMVSVRSGKVGLAGRS